MASNPALTGI
jgi:hypothetical protein